MKSSEKSPERERRDWWIFLLILLIGIVLMLCAGQSAIAMLPRWSVEADVNSHLNPDDNYVKQRLVVLEPINQDILTPPAWRDSILTLQPINTGAATVIPIGVFGTETNTPSATATPTGSSTAITLSPTMTVVGTLTRTPTITTTVSRTNTGTVTRTYTPTSTGTITATLTRTYTRTYTFTATTTITRTPTRTFTKTLTNSPTRTYTRTNTLGSFPTPTRTRTSPPPPPPPTAIPTVTGFRMCASSTSSASTGTLLDSGGSGANYSNNEVCTFLIQPGGGGSTITLSFSQFTTENVFDTDHLTVYDGTDSGGVNLGDFWGPTRPANLTATSGSMFLQWSSDTSNTFPGYIASWTSEVYSPSLVFTKTANPTNVVAAGNVITYTFSVQNTGNVPLSNITLSDTLLSSLSCTPIGNLLPGASQSFSCTNNSYTVTQGDLDGNGGGDGDIDNTASVIGTAPDTSTTSDSDSVAVTISQNPAITVVKEISPDSGTSWQDANTAPGPYLSSGTNPRFRFTVTNSGNVTLTALSLSDPNIGTLYEANYSTPCALPSTLAPGGNFVCYGALPWALGAQNNTATASGDFNPTTFSDSDDAYYFGSTPSIVLSKSASPSSVDSAGDVITYTFSVQNTGNVPLSNITLSDTLLSSLSCTPIGNLLPGASQSFSCTNNSYTVTQGDLDGNGGGDGDIDNTASVIGTAPDTSTTSDSNSVAVTFSQTPELTLTKSADRASVIAAGEVITYSFSVQNTGNVTLSNIALSDPFLVGLSCASIGNLPPGSSQSFTCSGNTYIVLQSDLDAYGGGDGDIDNTATVIGTEPDLSTTSDSDSVAVYLPAPTPTPTFTPPPPVTVIQTGTPDGIIYYPPDGTTLIFDLGIPLYTLSNPDGDPDLVYFERNSDPPSNLLMQMDQVVIELGDYFLNIWYMIFNWGDGVADTNSNLNINNPTVGTPGVGTPGAGTPEADNQAINKTAVPLYGTPALNTGITIDIDGILPPGTPYQWLRISVPTGGAGDGADIDSILILPTKTPTLVPTPTETPVPPTDTPVPTVTPTPIPPTDTPVPPTPTPTPEPPTPTLEPPTPTPG